MNRVRKVKSFEEFSNGLQISRPELVVVQPTRKPEKGLFGVSMTMAVGAIGNFNHGILYHVQHAHKQRRHIEPVFTVFQSERGFSDSVDRAKRLSGLILASEIRAAQLSLILPETEVYLGDPDLNPLPEDLINDLHNQVEREEIKVPEFVV